MNDKEKKFLEDNFKAGEYSTLTIMVKNSEVKKLIEYLKLTKLNLAILPSTQAKADYATIEGDGTEH